MSAALKGENIYLVLPLFCGNFGNPIPFFSSTAILDGMSFSQFRSPFSKWFLGTLSTHVKKEKPEEYFPYAWIFGLLVCSYPNVMYVSLFCPLDVKKKVPGDFWLFAQKLMCHTLYQRFLSGKRSCDRQYVCTKNKIRKPHGQVTRCQSRPVIIRRVYQNDLETDFWCNPSKERVKKFSWI